MSYKGVALSSHVSGSFVCATTVTVRTAVETSNRPLHACGERRRSQEGSVRWDELSRSERRSRSPSIAVFCTTDAIETSSSRVQQLTANPLDGIRTSLWMANSRGDIEIRSTERPEYALRSIPSKPRTLVTSLLQIGCNRVAAGLSDGFIRVFDGVTADEYVQIRAHTAGVRCLASLVTPVERCPRQDGELTCNPLFLSASSDRTIAKWDAVTLECLCRLKGHLCSVSSLVSTRSGVFVFSGSDDGSLHMWSMLDNTQVVGQPVTNQKTSKKRRNGKGSVARARDEHRFNGMKSTLEKTQEIKAPKHDVSHLSLESAVVGSREKRSPLRGSKSRRTGRSFSAKCRQKALGGGGESCRSRSLATARKHGLLPKIYWNKDSQSLNGSAQVLCTDVGGVESEGRGGDSLFLDDNLEDSAAHNDSNNLAVFCRSDENIVCDVNTPLETKRGRSKLKKKSAPQAQVFTYADIVHHFRGHCLTSALDRHLAGAHLEPNGAGTEVNALLWPLKGEHGKRVTHLVVVHDRLLLSASSDGEVRMLSLPSGRLLRTVHRSHTPVTGMTFDDANFLLWVATADSCYYVYNILTPDVKQVHGWRDISTPRPLLVPVMDNYALSQLYLLAAPAGQRKLQDALRGVAGQKCMPKIYLENSNTNCKTKKAGAATSSARGAKSLPVRTEEQVPPTPNATLTCIQLGDGDNEAMADMRLLRTLDAEHVKLRSKKYAAESKQDVYSRVLRRHTDINNVGRPDFIKKEWSGAINSLQNAHVHFFLSNMFRRWIDWVSRRVSRRQCMRRVRHLTAANQECLLSRYFRCWQGHRMKKKNLRGVLQLRLLEERVSFVGIGSPSAAVSQSLACKAGTALAEAQRRSLLQRYYKPWFYRVTRLRRNLTCSVAFNRLLLSYDTRLADTTFMFHSLTATNSRSQRHSRALWLLEQRMAVSHRQLQRCFFRKWLSFLRDQRDSNQTFHLVESLTSVLVDEVMLRARVYFRWYRFAMFEVKLRRFDEERATLQREWIVVQNAVESKETLPELQLEEEQLEVEIAQLAFERDEIESQNTLLRADIVHLQMNKSIERVLVGYTDPEDNAKVATRRTSSVPHNRRLHSASREYFSSPREDDSYAEAALLWQLSAVLRALKGTVLRCKRHSNIITSAYERVVRLPICEKAAESRDWSSSISYSSLGGDSSAVHGISGASLADTRNSSERRRSLVSLTHTTYLAEEFDRVVMRLQVLVTEAAKQASVDLDESINQAIAPFLKQAMEVANTECLPLQWLNFVPHTVRMEILPLLVELIVMYDSFKAHSDTEVEGVGKTISTRGTVKVVPLPLRSLCRMQTATWLVRHCVVVLEFMAPGTRDSHINMWILADSVKELVAVEKQGFTPGPPLGKSAKNNESTSDWKEMASFMSDTSVQTTKSSTREKRKQRSGCILNQSQSALGTQHGTAQSTPRTVAEGVQSFHSTPRKATPTLPHRKYMSTYSNPQSPKKPRILERITREQPAQPQRRCVATLSNLQSPKKHKIFEGSSTTDQVHPAPQRSNSVPLRQPNLIPAARSMISTPLTRPYLGFRVSVGYDENKRTTLSIQEVAHSYISSTCETEQIGPAYQAGLRVGDQLVRFAGYTVTDLAAFNTVVARHVRPSISIPVVFSRNGIVMSATIVVGEKNRE